MNRIEKFFFRYNVELIILGMIFCLAFLAEIWDATDDVSKIFFVLLGCVVIIPILFVAISRDLSKARIVFFVFTFIYTPYFLLNAGLALYFNYEGADILLHEIGPILVIFLFNVIVYKSYLELKFEKERLNNVDANWTEGMEDTQSDDV